MYLMCQVKLAFVITKKLRNIFEYQEKSVKTTLFTLIENHENINTFGEKSLTASQFSYCELTQVHQITEIRFETITITNINPYYTDWLNNSWNNAC